MRTWRAAWAEALYGAGGFYRRAGAGRDFRTPATADSGLLAAALLRRVPDPVAVTDVGAGDGSLLRALAALLPGVPLTGVDVGPRPPELPAHVRWSAQRPAALTGLVVACEWLDVVPCEVVVAGRLLRVDVAGREAAGGVPDPEDAAWLDAWWPGWRAGARAECGRTRDLAWADLLARLAPGATAVAIDYGHDRETRPDGGSLAGFAAGRQVVPVPDGSCDLTADVAWDSLAAVGGQRVRAPLPGWPRHDWLVLERSA